MKVCDFLTAADSIVECFNECPFQEWEEHEEGCPFKEKIKTFELKGEAYNSKYSREG